MRKAVIFTVFLLASFVVGALAAEFVFAKINKPGVSAPAGITLSFSEKTYKEKEKIQVPVDSKNPFVINTDPFKNQGKNLNLLTGKEVEQQFKTETRTTKTTMVTTTAKNSKKEERKLRILFYDNTGSMAKAAQWDLTLDAKGLIKKGKDTYVMEEATFNRVARIEVWEWSDSRKGYCDSIGGCIGVSK